MKQSTRIIVASPLLAAALVGCGGSVPATPPPATPKVTAAPTPPSTPAGKPGDEKPVERPAKRERRPTEKAKIAQLFQIPQFTKPASGSNYNDAKQDALPQIRLLGFSKIDGQLRALVQIKGEILAVQQGDVLDGAEVVAVDAEGVSFQFGGQRWASRLFEKANTSPVSVARVDVSTGDKPSGLETTLPPKAN